MSIIKVGLCVGTSCHLMGGMDLGTVIEELKKNLGDDLVVERQSCLCRCQNGPNVLLNGELLMSVTPERLKNEILARHDREGDI